MKPATHECLKAIGYPTDVLVLDFESKFSKLETERLGFKHQSTVEYITDPRFEFLGCGFSSLSVDSERNWFVDGPDLEDFFSRMNDPWSYGDGWGNTTVVAKNCKFDIALLQLKFGIMPKYTIDIDDLLRFYDSRISHRLVDVAKHFKLPPKGDTMQFADLSYADVKADPVMYKNLVDYTMRDIEDEVALLEIVLPMVGFTADEAALARHTLELFVYPRFKIDFALGTKLALGMRHQLAKVARDYDPKMLGSGIQLTKCMGELLEKYGEKVPLKRKGKNAKTGKQSKATKNMIPVLEQYGDTATVEDVEYCGPQFARDDDGCKWLLAHQDTEVQSLMEARIGLKSWPTHFGKVEGIMRQARCNPDDMLRVPIHYCGAHTARWTGGESINLLNMGSGGRGKPQHPLIGQVRSMFMAPDGYMIVIKDSAQIEARKLAWLAGQSDLVQQFADDADPYSVLATDIFQRDVWKWSDDSKAERGQFPELNDEQFATLKREIKLCRGFGKDAILGAGYGMGALKFYNNCLENPALRPSFDDGTYDFAFCKKIVDTYRKKYKRIIMFWRRVESAWAAATKHSGQTIMLNIPNSPSRLEFSNKGGATFIKLPSGRRLRYRNAKVGTKGQLKYRHNDHLWGGTLCLAGYTEVLTDSGWKRLDSVSISDKVWDGQCWCGHGGLRCNGLNNVIGVSGIDMTPDHKILTTRGWKHAKAAYGSTWENVWIPNGYRGFGVQREKLAMASEVQVWDGIPFARQGSHAAPWLAAVHKVFKTREQKQDTRHDKPSSLLGVEKYVRPLSPALTSGVEKLRRARYYRLRTLERVRSFLGRYGKRLRDRFNTGSSKQRRGLPQGKLSVGNLQGTSGESEEFTRHKLIGPIEGDRHREIDIVLPTQPRAPSTWVYDLQNCGTRNRFTVRDNNGLPHIVHNCENIDQASSRDLLTYWLLLAERDKDYDFRIALHTYDELVAIVPESEAEAHSERLQEIMCTCPDWASGMPLGAEGGISLRYKK